MPGPTSKRVRRQQKPCPRSCVCWRTAPSRVGCYAGRTEWRQTKGCCTSTPASEYPPGTAGEPCIHGVPSSRVLAHYTSAGKCLYCISRPAAITAAWPPSGRSMPQCLMFQARCEFALPLCLKNNAAMGGFCSFLATRPSRTSLKCSVVSALLARPLEPAGRLCHLHMSTCEVGAHVHVSSCATLKTVPLCPCSCSCGASIRQPLQHCRHQWPTPPAALPPANLSARAAAAAAGGESAATGCPAEPPPQQRATGLQSGRKTGSQLPNS